MGLLGLGVGVSQTRVWWGCFSGWQASTEVRLLLPGLPLTNGLSPGSCNALGGQCHPLPHCPGPRSCKLLPYLHLPLRGQSAPVGGAGQLPPVGNWILGYRL